MRYLHLRLTGEPDDTTRQALAERLTELAVNQLGKRRKVNAVTLEPVPAGRRWIGGHVGLLGLRRDLTRYLPEVTGISR